MKSKFFLIAAFLLAATSLNAQTWDELSDEQSRQQRFFHTLDFNFY